MHEARYLLSTACCTLGMTGQRQQLWEAREPGTAVKLGLCHGETRHMGSNVGVEHWPFAEALAPDVTKRHAGVLSLCHDAVAGLAHHCLTGGDEITAADCQAMRKDDQRDGL